MLCFYHFIAYYVDWAYLCNLFSQQLYCFIKNYIKISLRISQYATHILVFSIKHFAKKECDLVFNYINFIKMHFTLFIIQLVFLFSVNNNTLIINSCLKQHLQINLCRWKWVTPINCLQWQCVGAKNYIYTLRSCIMRRVLLQIVCDCHKLFSD